jgi:hypothetical protein
MGFWKLPIGELSMAGSRMKSNICPAIEEGKYYIAQAERSGGYRMGG